VEKPDLKSRVEKVLAEQVGPTLLIDGTAIEVIEVRDGIAQLRLNGVCSGCPSTLMLVINGIEQELRRHLPEVEYVEALP
jgi:Fe-S cluster biogenesis protein NfuA